MRKSHSLAYLVKVSVLKPKLYSTANAYLVTTTLAKSDQSVTAFQATPVTHSATACVVSAKAITNAQTVAHA